MATLWVHIELPQNTYFPIKQDDGIHMVRTLNSEYMQKLKYQDQYKIITDTKEIQRLLNIYNKEYNIHKSIFPVKKIEGLTDVRFHKIMEEIDEELKMENHRVQGREMRAIPKIAEKLKIDNLPFTTSTKVGADLYTTENIATHVYNWFKRKYGNKLNMQNNLAHMILRIKGTHFKVGFPLTFGTINIIFDSPLKKFPSIGHNKNGEKVIFNLATYIEDLTPALVDELSSEEIIEIVNLYGTTFNAVLKFQSSKIPYRQEALADLETAVDSFFYIHQQYGQSKWASLQFTEKVLKGILKKSGKKIPHIHHLNELSEQVKNNSGIIIDKRLIEKIECKPDVRYSADLVSAEEAIIAHYASLEVFRSIIKQI